MVINNPVRVAPNGDKSEFIFTFMRLPVMSEEQFLEDARIVSKGLQALKDFLDKVS